MARAIEEDILRSIRRMTRAIEVHSRKLYNTFGLTGPQLVCPRTIDQRGPLTPSALAQEVALSNATVTGIIDRLVARQLVSRRRSVLWPYRMKLQSALESVTPTSSPHTSAKWLSVSQS